MTINVGGKDIPATDGPDIDLDAETITVDGVRLTEAHAVELAREISRRHGRKGGRPRVGAGQTAKVAVRVPEATKQRLAAVAGAQHRTEAEVVREALDVYLKD